MLKNVPVLLQGYKMRVVEDPVVKTFTKDGKTEVATNQETGDPMYSVSIYMKPLPTEDGRRPAKGTEMKVTIERKPDEEIVDGAVVELHNPRISQFALDNGQTILSMRAAGLKLAG